MQRIIDAVVKMVVGLYNRVSPVFDRLQRIPNKYWAVGGVLAVVAMIVVLILLVQGSNFEVLNAKGEIAEKQRNLLIFGSLLSILVVLPVFSMTFWIVWKYRISNKSSKKAKYEPDWDSNLAAEAVWWLVPLALIVVLSVVTWRSSHDLDPYKPLTSEKKPLTIEVVAMQWKWLFIYPEQNIASVNYLRIPEDTPINFKITSDAPMNSFWIPQLGGQVYAMSGMETKLHLMADELGDYNGSSANLSGEGFAGMKFIAQATSEADFDAWVHDTKLAPNALNMDAYNELAVPSQDNPRSFYSSVEKGLYNTVIMKYMMPMPEGSGGEHEHMTHDTHNESHH